MNNANFPYATVYDFFAHRIIMAGLPVDGMLPPGIFVVEAKYDLVTRSTGLPQPLVELLFSSTAGKSAAGQLIRQLTARIPDDCCVVMVAECWSKAAQRQADGSFEKPAGSLENDPESRESVMISIYRPDVMRIGRLPISADRQVHYLPPTDLFEVVTGELSLHPGREISPEGAQMAH